MQFNSVQSYMRCLPRGVVTLLNRKLPTLILEAMQRTGRLQHTLTSAELQTKSTFNVVIAYEDLETGKHARHTYDYLAQHLGHDCRFTSEMWNFDVLSIPHLAELAAQDVARADIIIVACHGGAPLPQGVKSWIEVCLSQDLKAIALVALFDSPHDASARTREIRDYLAEVARRGNMEFFAESDRGTSPRQSSSIISSLPKIPSDDLDERFSASMEFRQRHETFPHWGINE